MIRIILVLILINNILFSQVTSDLYSEALKAYNDGQFAEASVLFSEFFKGYNIVDEKYASAKYYLAKSLLKLNRFDEAAIIFSFLSDNFHWTNYRSHSLFELGLIYYNLKDYNNSRSRMAQLLDDYPESEYVGSALYWIGESYAAEGNIQDAILFFENAINDKRRNKFLDYSIYSLANLYEKIGDYQSAVDYYDRLLTFHPNSELITSAQIRIGFCYFKLKDYQTAIIELNNPTLLNIDEKSKIEVLYILAHSYFRIEDYKNAETKFSEIIENYPSSEFYREALYGLGWSYFQQKKYNDAFKVFDFASNGNDSIAVKSFYWKGESKRYSGKDDEALQIFKSFLEKYPNERLSQDAQFQIGMIYLAKGNTELASRFLLSANNIENNETRAKALTSLGEIELEKSSFKNAINYFTEALNIKSISNETKLRALLGLAIGKFWTKDYNSSLAYLIEIEKSNRNFETQRVNYYYAENYFSLGNYREAINRFDRAFGNDDRINELSLYGKAYSHFNIGDYENSAEAFSEFVKQFRNSKFFNDAYLRLADSYFGSKNFQQASKIYEQIFRIGGSKLNNAYTRYQYAEALYKSGNPSEAIKEYEKIIEQFPNSEYAQASLFTVGWIFFQNAQYTDAINKYKEMFVRYPKSEFLPNALNSIGDSYFNMALYDSSIFYYERVINEFPNSPYVFDAVNGIQLSYVAQGRILDAVNYIDNFVLKYPLLNFSDQIFFKKGEIFYSEGMYSESKDAFKNFIVRYPKSKLVADAYYWIGKSAQNLNQNEEAIINFYNVFNLYKTSEFSASSILEIGAIYRKTGQYQKAFEVYNTGIKELPNSIRLPEIMFNKSLTLLEMNKLDEAYNSFNEIISNFPKSIFSDKSRLEIGIIEISLKKYDKANEILGNLSKKRTDDIGAKAQYYIGVSLFEQKKFSQAIEELNKVRNFFSRYEEWVIKSIFLIGDCYAGLKDKRKAEEMYRLIITKYKGTQYAKQAQDKIRKLK
ncbi:MAG: tetratricopeptide repeat protein [Ignavibacterium sp.]|nr:tetratricopeptide repeat protein [Ignavibacterium sp.]MDW8376203.1 tetratricopeptide repeat protein [Ignavibacteriales bacterium]